MPARLSVAITMVFLSISVVAAYAQENEPMDLAFFIDRLSGEDCWLNPIPDEQAYMASSNQPVFRRDCNAFLRTETDNGRTWQVLVDMDGPGVITRFWTAGDFDGALEIIVDSEPVIKTTLSEFFSGNVRQFIMPLTWDQTESSGGRVSYFPIPFGRHIKIRSDSDSDSFYWQINYSQFTSSQVVSLKPTLNDREKTALVKAENALDSHAADPGGYVETQTTDIPAGMKITWHIEGDGIIRRLSVTMPKHDWRYARGLEISMSGDGADEPYVQTGLSDLAHLGSKLRNYEACYSGFSDGEMWTAMPIPFEDGIDITLYNFGTEDIEKCTLNASIDDDARSTMRLHARTHHEYPEFGRMLTIEDIKGGGIFAGFSLITRAPASIGDTFFNQEGNEYITLDGENTVWRGTGTEDYFNCGYYYREGEVALPLSGCLDKRETGGGIISAYRVQKLDAVPYRKGIRVDLEPGCPKKGRDLIGQLTLDYRWTTFWYAPVR